MLQLSAVAFRRLLLPAEAQSEDAQSQQAALERRLTMAHAMLPEATAGQRPGVGSEAEVVIREELEEPGSDDCRVPAVEEKRPDLAPGSGRASGGTANLHLAPPQPDGRQPGPGSVQEAAASCSEPAAEGLEDDLSCLDALIAAEEAGELQASLPEACWTIARLGSLPVDGSIHWHSMPCMHLSCDALLRSVAPRPSLFELVCSSSNTVLQAVQTWPTMCRFNHSA